MEGNKLQVALRSFHLFCGPFGVKIIFIIMPMNMDKISAFYLFIFLQTK